MIHTTDPEQQLAAARETIRGLQDELAETNHGLLALTMELEHRVEERTIALRAAQEELQRTNSELLQLTLELEDRVAARTAELAQAIENLERSNQELEQFAYVATHDLQEPLRLVTSFTQLLARRYGGQLDQDAREFIGFAVEGAGRLQSLIQDLLAFSRVTTRGRPPAPLDSRNALDKALIALQDAIRESDALVTFGDLPRVMGDRPQVVQVFLNLVDNALKFRRPEAPPHIHVSAERAGDVRTIRVADNGIGIESRHIGQLFQIFRRLHARNGYTGNGIGLAICKRIIERHGGRIWVESEPGAGSTFYFTLPAAPDSKGEGP